VTTCLDLPTQRAARALAFFRREVIRHWGPKEWERYAEEFRDLASLYSHANWRPEDYDVCQLIVMSIMDGIVESVGFDTAEFYAEAGQGGAPCSSIP
jgi:hypothetical protein